MNYFDDFITEEELLEIEKIDGLYVFKTISLNDNKKRKFLDSYAYQDYLKKTLCEEDNNE